MAECYYLSVTNPYQGLLVGEPLAAPFAETGSGSWTGLADGARFAGTTNISLNFNAADAQHPLQQVDLFLDGTFVQTVTNATPQPGNILYVSLPGAPNLSYTVPANATLSSIARGVSGVLDNFLTSNTTQVLSYPHGDRIELQSGNPGVPGSQVSVNVSNAIGSASALTTQLQAIRGSFLDSVAWGILGVTVNGTLSGGEVLQLTVTKTNAAQVVVSVTNNVANQTVSGFLQLFANAINATTSLQSPDGLLAEDVAATSTGGQFTLQAQSQGYAAAQIQAVVTGSLPLLVSPATAQTLTDNLADLQPRDHLYVTAGLTNLPLTFAFNTALQPDGFHQLTAIAYEGTSVRAQTRISQNVRIQNTSLTATFTAPAGTNAAVEGALPFTVAASGGTISRIELFSTGGSLGFVSNQSTAQFSVPGTNLDLGLHPFYAVVTDTGGHQYRTETVSIRLVGGDVPFALSIAAPPPTLTWPATPDRSYDILSVTDLSQPFQLYDTVVPSNSLGLWIDTNPIVPARFYRVRVSP